MIIRHLQDAAAEGRRIDGENWNSVRLLLREDGMGFSFHLTTIYAGTETPIWYKNHLESVYCISGKGRIHDLGTGQEHSITPGMIYALDQNDRHILHADEDLQLACVFNPALVGTETHDEDGAYPVHAEPITQQS